MTVSYDECVSRLAMLGYEIVDYSNDPETLQFEIDKVIDYVVNYCNVTDAAELPDLLNKRVIDRICMEFLYIKKNSGQLDGFDYDIVVKTIKEGDTQVSLAVGQDGDTPESRFDKCVDYLYKGFDKWICKYRRLRW